MNGLQLAAAVREMKIDAPILLITGYAEMATSTERDPEIDRWIVAQAVHHPRDADDDGPSAPAAKALIRWRDIADAAAELSDDRIRAAAPGLGVRAAARGSHWHKESGGAEEASPLPLREGDGGTGRSAWNGGDTLASPLPGPWSALRGPNPQREGQDLSARGRLIPMPMGVATASAMLGRRHDPGGRQARVSGSRRPARAAPRVPHPARPLPCGLHLELHGTHRPARIPKRGPRGPGLLARLLHPPAGVG